MPGSDIANPSPQWTDSWVIVAAIVTSGFLVYFWTIQPFLTSASILHGPPVQRFYRLCAIGTTIQLLCCLGGAALTKTKRGIIAGSLLATIVTVFFQPSL
jgi:hypothetical protein